MDSAEPNWELPDSVWESMVGPFMSTPTSLERAAVEVNGIVSLVSVAPAPVY